MDVGELESEILKLEARQRARLAARLLSSLEELSESEHEQLWIEEAVRRDHELEQNPERGRSAGDVFRDARAKLR